MSRKLFIKRLLLSLSLTLAGVPLNYAWGLEAQAAQTYCAEVKQAVQTAQMKYLQAYQPHINPGQSFDEATLPCIDFIAKFKSNLPSFLDDSALIQAAQQLLQRTCPAAREQFDKAINEAKQSISGVVGRLPELSQDAAFYTPSTNAAMPVFLDSTESADEQPATRQIINRVINVLK